MCVCVVVRVCTRICDACKRACVHASVSPCASVPACKRDCDHAALTLQVQVGFMQARRRKLPVAAEGDAPAVGGAAAAAAVLHAVGQAFQRTPEV